MFAKHLVKDGLIWRSISDKKRYRFIELTNGLKAILVSAPKSNDCNLQSPDDSGNFFLSNHFYFVIYLYSSYVHAEKEKLKLAAAALAVRAGSFQDPFDVEGLAHFVEHTILMGNKQFPAENDFDTFLNERCGYSNASTLYEYTMFYFELPNVYFDEALKRFSAIFHSPLFRDSSIIKEIKPVDCEFKDAISSDDCRVMQILASLAKDKHPLSVFTFGNSYSLVDVPQKKGINLQKEVKKFWSQYYHAQNMCLSVLAENDLDTIEEMVRKYFSTIRSAGSIITKMDLFNSSLDFPYILEFHKLYIIEPLQSGDYIHISWSLPPRFNCYKRKPSHLVSMILGHEGNGSLYSYLKRSGLVLEFIAGNEESNYDANSYQSVFLIKVQLTELGMKMLDHVVNTIFWFINQIRIKGIEKFYFDEEQFIRLYHFQYADDISPSSYCTKLASDMLKYPLEDVLIGSKIYYDFDSSLINQALEYLEPSKANFILLSQKQFDARSSQVYTEKWFETKYRVEEVPSQWLNTTSHSDYDQIYFPAKNIFVADNFDLVSDKCDFQQFPTLAEETKYYRLWYKRDFTFKIPKATICILFSSPVATSGPLNALALDFFVEALILKMAEDTYAAEQAALSYSFKSNSNGLTLMLSGFNQKLASFLHVILDNIIKFDLDSNTFKNVQDYLASEYFNTFTDGVKLVKKIRLSILQNNYSTPLEKRSHLSQLSIKQVMEVVKSFFSDLFIECLIQGNMSKQESQAIIKKVYHKFEKMIINPHKRVKPIINQLPAGDSVCRILTLNREERGSMLHNYYQIGPMDVRTRCLLIILSSQMDEPSFDYLRTTHGLGYFVSTIFNDTFGIGGFTITIQSPANKFDCSFVDKKIETFLEIFAQSLLKKEQEKFEKVIKGLIRHKTAPVLNLRIETARNWTQIVTCNFCFDILEKEVKVLKEV